MIAKTKKRDGAASVEFLIVLVPWLIAITAFFNLLFLLSSIMINQSIVTRGVQQIAAMGCIHNELKNELQSHSGMGVRNVKLRAVAAKPVDRSARLDWRRSEYINADGSLKSAGPTFEIGSCDNPTRLPVPSGNFVFAQVEYTQKLPLLEVMSAFGTPKELTMHRSALTVSQALEGQAE